MQGRCRPPEGRGPGSTWLLPGLIGDTCLVRIYLDLIRDAARETYNYSSVGRRRQAPFDPHPPKISKILIGASRCPQTCVSPSQMARPNWNAFATVIKGLLPQATPT